MQTQNQIQCRRKKAKGGERNRGWIKCWCQFNVTWSSDFLSSLWVATNFCLQPKSTELWRQRLRMSPTHPLSCHGWTALKPALLLRWLTATWKFFFTFWPRLVLIIYFLEKLAHVSIPQLNQASKDASSSKWIICWHFIQRELLPRVCFCVGDFSILLRQESWLCHPLLDVRSGLNECECAPLFLHFSKAASTCLFLFMEDYLLIAYNNVFGNACVIVNGHNSLECGLCMCVFYFGTWCHDDDVARYQCVTALELTDESTEPDPAITFGCKHTSHTNFATWGHAVHSVFSFSFPLSAAVQYCETSVTLFQPSVACLEAVSAVVLYLSVHIMFLYKRLVFSWLFYSFLLHLCWAEKCTKSQTEKWVR